MADEKKGPGGVERRSGADRRRAERRKREVPVAVERRSGKDRRQREERRQE